MNLKKQQLIAISLAFCCAAVMPLQAEARKKENKTNETQPVVSSVPQPRSQKQVLIQNTPPETRRIKVQVRTIAAAPQLTAKEAKKAAKEKEKEAKKKSKEKNKTKQQKNETPIINRNNDKAGSSATAQGTLPKTVVSPALPVGYQEIGIFGEAVASKSQAVALLKQNNPDLKLTCSAEEIVDLYWQEASRE